MNADILEKLKKILTLANCSGATQGEVEAAMCRAKALAIRHNIDLASVDLTQDESAPGAIEITKDDSLRIRSKYMQPYHRWVFGVIEKVFGVSLVYHGHSSYGGRVVSRITLIGEAVDVAIATAIFPYLEKVFPATLSKAVSAGQLTYCAAHTNGCYRGLYLGIIAANKREEEKMSTEDKNKYAMVLVRKEDLVKARVEQEYPKLKAASHRERRSSHAAILYGMAKGQQINLRQVGAPSTSSTLK